ncbi:hypothetical protein RCG24_01725 [Neobacillus sp. OS1-32]|uniref:hypothetical protein n=1 Tax=Neobacillus sp. OS1-32 TaxID=3070682 RepID=UPI0027DFBAEA|nr:hypothetical protein [Neobacillus sp. OS1-32]WML30660.1 hypothetical protein RCG24_01725 [Neobacillus sp. OS1-32]
MEKILFFIMLMGILSSIFGKGKTNQQNRRNRPVSRDPFKQLRTFVQTENQAPKRNMIPTEVTRPKPAKKDLVQHFSEANLEMADPLISKPDPSTDTGKEIATVQAPRPPEVSNLPDNPDTNMIINGIIWSEILGKPRSKNPYFTGKR